VGKWLLVSDLYWQLCNWGRVPLHILTLFTSPMSEKSRVPIATVRTTTIIWGTIWIWRSTFVGHWRFCLFTCTIIKCINQRIIYIQHYTPENQITGEQGYHYHTRFAAQAAKLYICLAHQWNPVDVDQGSRSIHIVKHSPLCPSRWVTRFSVGGNVRPLRELKWV